MSAALVILPMVWAAEARRPVVARKEATEEPKKTAPELAFYRKYTEALLRRYVRLSMESGKVPSLIGKEMFRGRVTHYSVQGFDDMVIFVHDVERCLITLTVEEQEVIRRVGLQEYTQAEAAELMGLPLRTLHRRYADALDVLTEVFLERRLLEPSIACQEA